MLVVCIYAHVLLLNEKSTSIIPPIVAVREGQENIAVVPKLTCACMSMTHTLSSPHGVLQLFACATRIRYYMDYHKVICHHPKREIIYLTYLTM
jgi:hypothetical protein